MTTIVGAVGRHHGGAVKRDVSAAHRRVEGQTFAGTLVQTATMDVTISVLRDVDHSVLR